MVRFQSQPLAVTVVSSSTGYPSGCRLVTGFRDPTVGPRDLTFISSRHESFYGLSRLVCRWPFLPSSTTFNSVVRAQSRHCSQMAYIPQHALENLRKYSYKGVDKCVLITSWSTRRGSLLLLCHHHLNSVLLLSLKVLVVEIRPWSFLDLVRDAMASQRCTEYRE